jgi:hypothetical protein
VILEVGSSVCRERESDFQQSLHSKLGVTGSNHTPPFVDEEFPISKHVEI